MNLVTRLVKEEEGQALTEYGLIIGLVAVICIAAIGAMGSQISGLFNRIAAKLASAGI
ncbi:Flp family type IVb pilin [Neobacillus piezotolerans]|uniref:Flp family type IVb pilin n=1 Tax=Neobacillus piezotolerans TaxID=2259171 RepID=A0A3D8GK36_9BACI|nr:Flp family type IVb pilin [Neobacillus piezotolerans]RDU34657.1 Flp family type IVb pilin [Neobacillus piezotolerans]